MYSNMPIQSRKNNNKYNNNKYNKNKRTRKRPLQKGGETKIFDIKDKQLEGDLSNQIIKYITYILKKPNEFIQIDENIYFFTEPDASELYQIIQKNTNGSKASLRRIIKELFKDQFAEEITIFLKKNKINKEVIYKGRDHGFNPNPSNQKEGIPYTLFIFETIEADNEDEAEAEIVSSVDTKVEVDKADKADSEQKKKLLHEANQILKNINNTDKGIKTYLNSKEYKDSEFKKLSVEFITQNPYITNDAINKLTFT